MSIIEYENAGLFRRWLDMPKLDRTEQEKKTTEAIHELLMQGSNVKPFPNHPVVIRKSATDESAPDEVDWNICDLGLDAARSEKSRDTSGCKAPLLSWFAEVGLARARFDYANNHAAWLRGVPMPQIRQPDRYGDTSDERVLKRLVAPLVLLRNPEQEGDYVLAHPQAWED